jgi:hypothetical protein
MADNRKQGTTCKQTCLRLIRNNGDGGGRTLWLTVFESRAFFPLLSAYPRQDTVYSIVWWCIFLNKRLGQLSQPDKRWPATTLTCYSVTNPYYVTKLSQKKMFMSWLRNLVRLYSETRKLPRIINVRTYFLHVVFVAPRSVAFCANWEVLTSIQKNFSHVSAYKLPMAHDRAAISKIDTATLPR